MAALECAIEGVGLHTGAAVRVRLVRRPGPVALRRDGAVACVGELHVASTARATSVASRDGALRVGTVEHLFAALAGLGVREGLEVAVEGPELPLLDGGASAWCAAVDTLGIPPSPPGTRVLRDATIAVGASSYRFVRDERVAVHVWLELEGYGPDVVAPEAAWSGDPDDFRGRIAPARTFAFAHDIEELAAKGLARHVNPASVVVLSPAGALHAGRPCAPDEPARHKLLDLLGDLYVHGGPPLGTLRAVRPGHAANDEAMRRAWHEGVVGPARP